MNNRVKNKEYIQKINYCDKDTASSNDNKKLVDDADLWVVGKTSFIGTEWLNVRLVAD